MGWILAEEGRGEMWMREVDRLRGEGEERNKCGVSAE